MSIPDESRFNESKLPEWPESEPESENEGTEPDADLTPEVQAVMEALFSDPFPEKPFALIPVGGENTPEYKDYIIHKDLDTEHQCVFVFDSVVDAFAVAEEYKQATGKEAEAVECDIYFLDEERFWLKYYRSNGIVAILSIPEYKKHVQFSRDY